MTERLFLELKSKFKDKLQVEEENSKNEFLNKDPEINKMLDDLQLTLQSLNYTKNEIKNVLPIIFKGTDGFPKIETNSSFENLLKLAMNYLDNNSSNLTR